MSRVLLAFAALAEPSRRRIVELLGDRGLCVGELVEELGLSQPAVSKHLRVLKEAQLVESEVDGQRRLYRLRTEPLAELDQWLAPYRKRWSDRLDALERHLDSLDGPPSPSSDARMERTPRTGRRRKSR